MLNLAKYADVTLKIMPAYFVKASNRGAYLGVTLDFHEHSLISNSDFPSTWLSAKNNKYRQKEEASAAECEFFGLSQVECIHIWTLNTSLIFLFSWSFLQGNSKLMFEKRLCRSILNSLACGQMHKIISTLSSSIVTKVPHLESDRVLLYKTYSLTKLMAFGWCCKEKPGCGRDVSLSCKSYRPEGSHHQIPLMSIT